MEKIAWSRLLFLISGVLVLANSVVLLSTFPFSSSSLTASELAYLHEALIVGGIVGIVCGIALVALGYFIGVLKEKTRTLAILGILFALLSIVGNGGFIIGFILGIIGGAMALTK